MYIKVKVLAGVKKEIVVKQSDTHFEMCVKEKPERNMANRRIIELVAKEFSVRPQQVRIISGHHSGSKILSVTQ
ncbi:MAG TPA: DUF167 domain-containing protein [Candidatus Paceibacterota bacterium]|nr:DUF167 domain-containing protein [Candidatus Paceibacterota bacterium]